MKADVMTVKLIKKCKRGIQWYNVNIHKFSSLLISVFNTSLATNEASYLKHQIKALNNQVIAKLIVSPAKQLAE
jgi:hypothetical protein